jgi:hypothetical protein
VHGRQQDWFERAVRDAAVGVQLPQGTGAGGSPGVVDNPAGVGGGPVIANPVVSIPGASSQVPANMPTVPVVAGDSSGMSSDSPVNGGALQPGPLTGPDSYLDTGSGSGSPQVAHPNSQARG